MGVGLWFTEGSVVVIVATVATVEVLLFSFDWSCLGFLAVGGNVNLVIFTFGAVSSGGWTFCGYVGGE